MTTGEFYRETTKFLMIQKTTILLSLKLFSVITVSASYTVGPLAILFLEVVLFSELK